MGDDSDVGVARCCYAFCSPKQEQIASLFGTQRPAITKHLENIFKSGEPDENEVSSIPELTSVHGAIAGKAQIQREKCYNPDAILSAGKNLPVVHKLYKLHELLRKKIRVDSCNSWTKGFGVSKIQNSKFKIQNLEFSILRVSHRLGKGDDVSGLQAYCFGEVVPVHKAAHYGCQSF